MLTNTGVSVAVALQFGLLLWQVVCPAEGKLETGTVQIRGGAIGGSHWWQYVGKFGYAIGTGEYEVRLRLRQPVIASAAAPHIDFEVFLDEDWASVETLAPCDRASATRTSNPNLRIRMDGEWGDWEGGVLAQAMRPHIWYFALSSCHESERGELENTVYDIDYELHFRQFDGSELSVEMRHMLSASALAMLCLATICTRFTVNCQRMRQSLGKLHPVIWVLAIALKLQCAALALHVFHLFSYEQNGVGAPIADVLAEVFFMLSQVVNVTLLIVIAQGYTLLYSRVFELPLVRPAIITIAILHVVLVGFGKFQGEASYKYHENEGIVGWTLLALRLLLFTWFNCAIRLLQRSSSFKLQYFLHQFELAGSTYLLAYPMLFAIVQMFAPYLQHPILQIGLLAMQTASSLWLASLFLSRGAYFEVSMLSWSLLPGGAKLQ